jgi:hypothetical protein
MSSLMFSPEANYITVSASSDVAANITITTADGIERYDQTSTYTPVGGVITFGDLSELINKCILLMDSMRTLSLTADPSPRATLSISVTEGQNTVTATSKVLFCTAGNASSPSTFKVFGTQLRKRYIREDIDYYLLWLPLLAAGTTFAVQTTVTYVNSGVQSTASGTSTYTATSGSEKFQYINAAMPVLVRNVLGSSLYASATVYFYQVDILINNVVYDSVEFTVDRRSFPQESLWYFQNSFGLVDQLLLRGHEEESHSLDATFGYCLWNEVSLDAEVRREFKTNSGWLTKGEFRLVSELYRAALVGRQEELGLRRVVVRDIDVARSAPSNEPQGVEITWRYADRRIEWEGDIDGNTLGHNIFADSFAIEFD